MPAKGDVHIALFFLHLSAKYGFAHLGNYISDSLWKDFSTHSSQLLNETLVGKAVQVPTPSDLPSPPQGQSPGGCHPTGSCLQGCCTGGCIWAEVPKLLTLFSTQQEPERRKGVQMVQETVSFQKWKARDQSLLPILLCPPCQKMPAVMSQSPLNNVL